MRDREVQELLDKRAIDDVIARYSRALDRMDRELALTVWHPDGTADYGSPRFTGPAAEVIDAMWQAHAMYDRHSHQMTNRIIDVDGDRAVSETYGFVTLRKVPEDGSVTELVIRSRYLDRWSRRGGRWAIDHRQFVIDFSATVDYPESSSSGSVLSRRDPSDPSFELFAAGTAAMR